jgi:hypothetical protein
MDGIEARISESASTPPPAPDPSKKLAPALISPDAVLVRGTPVIGLCHFIEKELDPAARARVYAGLPPKWAGSFANGTIFATDRVPLPVVNQLTVLAAEAKGEPLDSFARRAGNFGAKEGINSVFKSFFFILSVANALAIAPLMWTRIYNAGKMKVDSAPKKAAIHVTEFPGQPAVCGRITGWFSYIGELSGAKNIRARHEICTSRGAPECVWEFDWD